MLTIIIIMAKYNVDLVDEHNFKDVWVHDGVIFSGDTKCITERDVEDIISPLLGAAVLGLNNTQTPAASTSEHKNLWTDIDVQETYLNSKPTCYLILGKPGVGAYSLGEALSRKYNCVHLCPKNVLMDEIMQGSVTGKCLDFNMKHNHICSPKTILKMLKRKIESPAVQHRGYVISGIPFVTACKDSAYLIKTNHSESALDAVEELLNDFISNLNRKKRKPLKTTDSSRTSFSDRNFEQEAEEEEEIPEEEQLLEEAEEEIVAELPKYLLDSCCSICFNIEPYFETNQTIYLQQLEGLFNLDLKPDVILFITCPDADVVSKKLHKYINYKNGHNTFKPFLNIDASDLRWPTLYNIHECENPHDIHVFNYKYNCRPPINFSNKSIDQICNYKNFVLPFIEKTLKDYDPKQVIKLDGRTSTYLMMHQITERLLLMCVNPIIIPEPLYIEEPPDDFEDFWKKVEESNVIGSGVLKFERCASPWVNRCPVELKLRQSVVGKPKLAVMFFKHVYLMYSLKNFISFCRNPRPFLKLQYLEPTCRIIVTGTKSSGKTMTAECLSWLFDTPVSKFEMFIENKKEMKYQIYAKTILSEIIATIEDARFIVWQQQELDRMAHLNNWNNVMLSVLTKYVSLFKIIHAYEEYKATRSKNKELKVKNEEETFAEDEYNISEEENLAEELDPEIIAEFNSLREELSFLPIVDSLDDCEIVVMNSSLIAFAPSELVTMVEKPPLPVLGDDDVTKAISEYIVANDLQKEIEPTIEETMDEIIKFISDLDTKTQGTLPSECYGKYIIDGFPSDTEYWEYLSSARLMPDYTIAILENREIEPELMLHYLNIENCVKNYQETFASIKDPLILSKLQTKNFANTNMLSIKMITNDLVNNCFRTLDIDAENTDTGGPSAELISTFTEAIEKFHEDWDSVKIKLEDISKCYIEVELENKSDIDILKEVLLKLRQCYFLKPELNEEEVVLEEEDNSSKDLLSYNFPQNLCETSIYCPISYFKYAILWEGKQEFSLKYDSKIHYFANEEFLELFQRDVTKYQAYNKPFKKIPSLKICITGCLGSGATTLSKYIAAELGLIHIDFKDYLNNFYLPRHFKKVGRKYENPFNDAPIEEEGVVEYQMDEENPNLLADILSNEGELRRMFYNYYERGQPVIPIIMHKIIKKLWFEYPFTKTGFVIDGYPRLPQDIEDLALCNCIPDLVIAIDASAETAVERLGAVMFNQWKSHLKQAKEVYRLKTQHAHHEWTRFITKKVVVKLIIEEILDNIIEEESLPKNKDLSYDSFIFDAHPLGPVQVDPKLFSAYNEMVEEYPEVNDTQEWDKPEDVREGINSRLEAIHESDYENIESLKEVALDNKIKLTTIDGTKPFYKVCRQALARLASLRDRSQSFFERTLIIPNDIAELLLSQGFYFLSKFGRLCPVYIHENPHTIFNSYKISKRKGKLYPVIHRAYIYFISSEENVNKFRTNPLKYVTSKAIETYYTYPLRIGVIGAPKTGKSSLSTTLAIQNNLLCISRGMALRHVLEHMHWTELASDILKNIRSGNVVDSELILNAIQTVALDHHVSTYGFVLDGFPSTPYEAMVLSKNGLYPNIIFEISSDKRVILHNSQNEVHNNILKYKPPYAYSFIEDRFAAWNEQSNRIRQWIKNDYQNICILNGNGSKWQCLQDANVKISNLVANIHYYLANVENKIVPANSMTISNDTFQQKQSGFRNMCPACIRTNVLRHSGYISDKTGIVQYKNKLYWICNEHLNTVLMYPEYYLTTEISIPELPAIVKIINSNNVYENGICIVTYAENLPAQKLERGTNKFAAIYKLKTYLFCSDACLHKFLDKPHLYCDLTVFKESSPFPRLSLNKLPHLGYLEQTLANILTEACCAVNVVRPKYPGLTFPVSALIYIGLFLKSHNGRLPKQRSELYNKALKRFEQRSKLILELGLRMRSMENPFFTYHNHGDINPQKYSSPLRYLKEDTSSTGVRPSSLTASPKTSRVPVPDERFDYLCEFHKPASKVPAFLNVVDIAGLVRGAAEGQGLGNAFLSHIKACDAIFNLCRAFDDEDVIHVDGDVNPVRDLETIGEELRLKDEEQLMQNIEKLDRVVNRGNDKKLKPEYDTLQKIKTVLVDEKKHIRFGDWSAADIEILNKYLFLTSKPALYLVNLSEKDYIRKKNKWLPKLKEWIDKNDPGAPLIPFSGALEMKLAELDPAERQAYLKENNLTSALDKIIVQGYKALQLEYFFTAGVDEVKAWTIQKGTKAPQAAGRIHTDFEKGFIMAEVMHFKDFKEEGTEAACKAAGKYRQQGRNYVVEDGDIIFFKFNAGAGLKDAKKK